MQQIEIEVAEGGERIDRYLTLQRPDLSRSYVQKLVDDGLVTVNARPVRSSYRLRPGDRIGMSIPPPDLPGARPEHIPLSIVYEDADVLVIDKPAGLVVHPAPGHASGTLVNAVLAHAPQMVSVGEDATRPGIVHRLDKDTSGLLVVAKNERALRFLNSQFKDRTTEKTYLALLHGHLTPASGEIDAPIGRDQRFRQRMAIRAEGRAARTGYRVVRYVGNFTLVEALLYTGRTHQIRVHFASIGYPLAGDPVYGQRLALAGLSRQFLHSTRLRIRLPSDGEPHEFSSPLPADLAAVLREIETGRG